MVTAELLSTAHGQVALKAVQRFLSHNPEWVGQTIGRVEHSLQWSEMKNLLLVGGKPPLCHEDIGKGKKFPKGLWVPRALFLWHNQ